MVLPRFVGTAMSVALLVTLAGCGRLAHRRLEFTDTEQVRITRITLSKGQGDVKVATAAISEVRVKRVVTYVGDEPAGHSYRIDGDNLLLNTGCAGHCSVSYEILAPQGVAVTGENGSGDVTLTGVGTVDLRIGSGDLTVDDATGTVRARTGSGSISVSGVSAAVALHTGSGDVTGRRLGGGAVDAETGSGDVSLQLATSGPVRADTGSGSIDLTVPVGRYRVKSRSSSGENRIGVQHDPTASILLDLHSGSGDITVNG